MFRWFKKSPPASPLEKQAGFFSTDVEPGRSRGDILLAVTAQTFQKSAGDFEILGPQGEAYAMDADNIQSVKRLSSSFGQNVPDVQLGWYGSQGFIGYQTCAIIAQNWLVDKACTMPARDAMRNGYEVTVNDGTEVETDVLDYIKKMDKKFKLRNHCVQFVRNGRIFGIRIAMFIIESKDPEYYEKPFNPDGITEGSYKGITQIDPYWITPELSQEAAVNPASLGFYEPTWWRINGRRIHKSHLIIMRNGIVPDILKPSYLYGGIPVPQKIFERVYAAERTANEAPMLAMSKRLTALKVDMTAVMADQLGFEEKMSIWTTYMNNYGVKILGGDEELEQFDTSLADMDALIMTQYQLVAAIAECPATKILGTSPKGFNASGLYEESNYHEFLESIQEHDCTPLMDRHHLCLIRSEVAPKFKIEPFDTEVKWNPVDSPTAKELAETNLIKAQTDSALAAAGGIDGIDVRARLIADKDSGYNGMAEMPEGGFETDQDDDDE